MTLNHKDTSAISPEEALPTKEFQPVETHCEQNHHPEEKITASLIPKKNSTELVKQHLGPILKPSSFNRLKLDFDEGMFIHTQNNTN